MASETTQTETETENRKRQHLLIEMQRNACNENKPISNVKPPAPKPKRAGSNQLRPAHPAQASGSFVSQTLSFGLGQTTHRLATDRPS